MSLVKPTPITCFAQPHLVVIHSEKWCGPVTGAQARVESPVQPLTCFMSKESYMASLRLCVPTCKMRLIVPASES